MIQVTCSLKRKVEKKSQQYYINRSHIIFQVNQRPNIKQYIKSTLPNDRINYDAKTQS
jgi:hypothetical protein